MERSMNFFLVERNEAQIKGVAVVKKAPSPWKIFFEKNPSNLFVQIRPTKRCVEVFKNKWVSRYLTFADVLVPKNCSLP